MLLGLKSGLPSLQCLGGALILLALTLVTCGMSARLEPSARSRRTGVSGQTGVALAFLCVLRSGPCARRLGRGVCLCEHVLFEFHRPAALHIGRTGL